MLDRLGMGEGPRPVHHEVALEVEEPDVPLAAGHEEAAVAAQAPGSRPPDWKPSG